MRRFLCASEGNIAVLFALLAAVILGAAGLGLDYAFWTRQRTALQEAADAGAIAGAVELGLGGADAVSRAEQRALAVGAANLGAALRAASSAATADSAAKTVRLSYSMNGRRSVSAVLVKADPTLAMESTARIVKRVVACIYALNTTASKSMHGNGAATLTGSNCAIQVNSSSASALSNSATIKASHICVVGGYSGSGYAPTPQTGCPALADPFLETAIPEPGACSAKGLSVTSDRTLSPSVYCGGLSVSSDAILSLQPGIYHIVDGDLKISGGGSVRGDGVVFVLSGSASLDISGGGAVVTTPPSSGSLAGFSVVQDRAAPLGGVSKITGEGRFEFPGAIYLPRQSLELRGRAVGNDYVPTYAAIVADRISVGGTGELHVTADTSYLTKNDAAKLTIVNVALIK
jgi:hypothetical protein